MVVLAECPFIPIVSIGCTLEAPEPGGYLIVGILLLIFVHAVKTSRDRRGSK